MNKKLYFKEVEIVEFSGGGKVSQMDNQMRFSDVIMPIIKKFSKFDFAITDDTHVYLYKKVFRKKMNKVIIAFSGFYKQNCTIEKDAYAAYMVTGKLMS